MQRQAKTAETNSADKKKTSPGWIKRAYLALDFKEYEIPDDKKVREKKPVTPAILNIRPHELVVKEKISKGNYGKVFAGTWRQFQVAIKTVARAVPMPGDVSPPAPSFYYDNEKRAFAKIAASDDEESKTHIVNLLGCLDSSLQLVLELAPRGSLANFIDNEDIPADWETCRNILLHIAKAICFLQKIGILYSDVKSQNVLLLNDMQIKLCDFGLATFKEDQTENRMVGTPEYMAPEVVKGFPYTQESEAFSLAQLAWEVTAWEVPFYNEESTREVYRRIKLGLFDPVPTDAPTVLKELIDQGRQMNPADRPNMEAIIEKLASSEPLETLEPRVRLSNRK